MKQLVVCYLFFLCQSAILVLAQEVELKPIELDNNLSKTDQKNTNSSLSSIDTHSESSQSSQHSAIKSDDISKENEMKPVLPNQEVDSQEHDTKANVEEEGKENPKTSIKIEDEEKILKANKGSSSIAEQQIKAEENSHDQLRFISSSIFGEAGLLRVVEAGSTPVGILRMNFFGSFFTVEGSQAFLNYTMQPVYRESYLSGQLSLAYTPLPFLECFLGVHSSVNKNSLSMPQLIQTQGDLLLGAKGFYKVVPGIQVGLDLILEFFNGIGELEPSLDGTNLRSSFFFFF